jgi:hypothetical protein
MATSGTSHNDFQAYLQAWTAMMITIWQEKLIMLNVNDTWELYNSLKSNVLIQSGGQGAKISFSFNKYGMYSNAGVGKEISLGNTGDVGRQVARMAKPWFDQGWYRSVGALKRDVARIYGETIAKNIIFTLNGTQA